MLSIQLHEATGRASNLAAFHAAQALIFERSGKIGKTHRGVHVEFQRVTKDSQSIGPKLRSFLSRAYNLKAMADYETGPESGVSRERATEAVAEAKSFVAHVAGQLGGRTT